MVFVDNDYDASGNDYQQFNANNVCTSNKDNNVFDNNFILNNDVEGNND